MALKDYSDNEAVRSRGQDLVSTLGWKTYKYYYETDELPNPRPTQPKKQ